MRSLELGMRFSQNAWRNAFLGPLGAGIGLIVMAIYAETKYGYDASWRIDKVVEPFKQDASNQEGHYTTSYRYDALNRLREIVFPDETYSNLQDNPRVSLDYEPATNKVTITDEEDHQVIERSDWAGRLVQATVNTIRYNSVSVAHNWYFTYDSLGRKLVERNPKGKDALFEFSYSGALIKQQLPGIDVLSPSSETVLAGTRPTVTSGYDERGNKIWEIGPNGNAIENSSLHQVDYVYDALNRLIKVTQPSITTHTGTQERPEQKCYYDGSGNKTKVVDANNLATTYTYNSRGWLESETNAAGERTSYSYDAVGNRNSMTDPRGNATATEKDFTTWFVYDALRRPIRVVYPDKTPPTDPFADPQSIGTSFDNPYTQTIYTLNGLKEFEYDPRGVETKYVYDRRKRVTEVWVDNVKRVTNTYDKVGNLTSMTDAEGLLTKYEYDYIGQMLSKRVVAAKDVGTIPDYDIMTVYEYDGLGNKTMEADYRDLTHATSYGFDDAGRLSSVTDALTRQTQYEYDPNGNLRRTTDANQNKTVYRYNAAGWQVEEVDSLNKTTAYFYDLGGLRRGMRDRNTPAGIQTATYQYYSNNLLQMVAYRDGMSVTYTYDSAGNRQRVNQVHNSDPSRNVDTRYNRFDPADATKYSPDPLNRINEIQRTFAGEVRTTKYAYDIAGNLTSIQYPGSTSWVKYTRDNLGRITDVLTETSDAQTKIDITKPDSQNPTKRGVEYGPAGVLKYVRLANSITLTMTPDELHRTNENKYELKLDTETTTVLNLKYTYKPHQLNVESLASGTGQNEKIEYDYDKLDQLTAENYPDMESITKVGNATLSQTTITPGAVLTMHYNWIARPTITACQVATYFIDANKNTILWSDTHDPSTYLGMPTSVWSGVLGYHRTLAVPANIVYHGPVKVAVALVAPSGERLLLWHDEANVPALASGIYQVAAANMNMTSDPYHNNVLHDDFRDTSRLTSYDCMWSSAEQMTATSQVYDPNLVIYDDPLQVVRMWNSANIMRTFQLNVDPFDRQWTITSNVHGKGYIAIFVDGVQKFRHDSNDTISRTYSDILDASEMSAGAHTVEVVLCSTGIMASITNEWIKVEVSQRCRPIGGTITGTTSKTQNIRVATVGASTGSWNKTHTMTQDGYLEKLKVVTTVYSSDGGSLVIKLNGSAIYSNSSVPSGARQYIILNINVTQISEGQPIAIQTAFTANPPPDPPERPEYLEAASIVDETVSGRGMEIIIAQKKVITRTYKIVTKTHDLVRNGYSLTFSDDAAGTVTWQVFDGITSKPMSEGANLLAGQQLRFEATLTQSSETRTLATIDDYTVSTLSLVAAPTAEQPCIPARTYDYDGVGNRISYSDDGTPETWDMMPGSNRLASTGDSTFLYDCNGNMTSRAAKDGSYTWTYIYDARNCLVEVKKDSVAIAQYYYDDVGNRIKAVYPRDAEAISFDFDLTGIVTENPIAERYSDGRFQNYIYLNRRLLARVDGDIADLASKMYWYLTDQLGSTRGLTDKEGHLVWRASYEAFGKAIASSGDGMVSEMPRFTGKTWDERVGLYYFNARWYQPDLGSFISEDPLQQGNNNYQYAAGNPIRFSDPSGLFIYKVDPKTGEVYAIAEKDDTLSELGKEFYGDASYSTEIAAQNDIEDENLIQEGQRIKLPSLSKVGERNREKILKLAFILGEIQYAVLVKCGVSYYDFSSEELDILRAFVRRLEQLHQTGQITDEQYNSEWQKLGGKDSPFWENAFGNTRAMGFDDPVLYPFYGFLVFRFAVSFGLMLTQPDTASKGSQTPWPGWENGRQIINGLEYSIHALQRMAPPGTIEGFNCRGVPPSVVANCVKNGLTVAGNMPGTLVHIYENVMVVTNEACTLVISVISTGAGK